MKDLDYGRYIDRYLDGVMTSEEKKWFELELQGNPDLQSELDLFRKINRNLADRETIEFSEQLNAIHSELYETEHAGTVISKRSFRTMAMAVGAATLMLFGIVFTRNQLSSTNTIAENFFEPIEANLNYRSLVSETSDDLKTAMNYYEKKDFEKAIVLFESIIQADQQRVGLNLYSGISHMEIEDFEKANARFYRIINHGENAFYESAQWYLGLSYLMTGEHEKAIELFKSLSANEGFYQKDAKKILRRID